MMSAAAPEATDLPARLKNSGGWKEKKKGVENGERQDNEEEEKEGKEDREGGKRRVGRRGKSRKKKGKET